ncbi:MAG TPA: serine/threonine-protein kinase, partial [Vicinamibacteria bacterium]|nr:serine/threonine-protein kinase [Vicinamibacteria bacterium]
PYPVEWKLDVLGQVCEGLSYAHRNGIVHRDVKPANIRVTPDGDAKIVDFGIAHLQSSQLTKSGLVLGTVHYMSPEQIEGGKVDHRADIFSVGAIAYELLSYRKPFDGESLTGVMYKITHERADPAALPATEYSPGLERIIVKALARDIAERYRSLDEMHSDLAALVREHAPRVAALVEQAARGGPKAATAAEAAALRAQMREARAGGQLQRALSLCRKLLELEPGDADAREAQGAIQGAINAKEVEQLSSQALAYAAEGDVDLALKIAGRIERIAPGSPASLELRRYLDEEGRRVRRESFTAAAQEHLVEGDLQAAHEAAERALEVDPQHALAREIR